MTQDPPSQAGSGKPRIVIVEDDQEFADYLSDLLEDIEAGAIEHYADGVEGLNACLASPPDLVVLDLNLPSLRGEEICRLLRSSPFHRPTRILVCSDMPEAKKRELELLKIGADIYFEKPFSEGRFVEVVERLLREAARARKDGGSGVFARPGADIQDAETTRTQGEQVEKTRRRPAFGEEFCGYRIEGVVGGGAMGTVYRAQQIGTQRVVALKVFLREEDDPDEAAARFQREAVIMAHLEHPHVTRVYDSGSTGFTYYIAMEFMEGGSLMDIMRREGVTRRRFIDLISHTTSALAYLHARDVIHRDIKPANILVSGNGTMKLGDFGVSRARLPLESDEFTRRRAVLGTRTYMAPEVLVGKKADALSDQYSLGRTLLRVFEGPRANVPPRSLQELRPDLPVPLSDAIDRMIHVDPAQRFAGVEEAGKALLAAMGVGAAPP